MAKVLRTHQVRSEDLVQKVREEILFLTRGVACPECVEIIFESDLYQRLQREIQLNDRKNLLDFSNKIPAKVLGFDYRVVYGPGVRFGSMAVLIRSEVVFK